MNINERTARAYLSLITEPGDGVVGVLLHNMSGGEVLEHIWNTDGEVRNRCRPRMVHGLDEAKIQAWMEEQVTKHNLAIVIPGDPSWPTALDDLEERAPHALWARGNPSVLGMLNTHPSVAIVGARAATSYGEHVATELAVGVTEREVVVVSGASYGIDGAAHRATVTAGGRTIAFLAGGVDRPYPAGHAGLIDRIAAGGAVVSEVPPGASPTKWRFLQRNRLIAASTSGMVVVEAGFRSGSLNAAAHAASLNRPLGAVPGPITSAASAGCHRLINEYDATLITSTDDVLNLIGVQSDER